MIILILYRKNMNHTEVITGIFAACRYKNYLELGVYEGETLESVSNYSSYSVGVDIKDIRKNKNLNLFLGQTQEFFESNTNNFDMIFIDADHHVDAIRYDLQESLKILNEYGTIILHDTDPEHKHLLDPGYCNNGYLIHDFLESNNFSWVTLPVDNCGMTIIRKKNNLRHIKII